MTIVGVIAVLLITRGETSIASLVGGQGTPTTEPISTPTSTQVKATATVEPELEATATKKQAEPPATKTVTGGARTSTATSEPSRTSIVTPTPASQEPTIGPITFATGITEDDELIDAGTSFPSDVEEIHALFSYEGLSDSDTWERIWYQDDEEVGSGSGTWDAGKSGTFDLSLTGGGEPLGPGTWKLEIYINGELTQMGKFVIEASATPDGTSSPVVGGTYRIAFARWDGGKHDLFIANTDGSGERFLMQRAAGPSWSRDGQYLSFFGEEGVDRQIRDGVEYVINDITNAQFRS